MRALNVNEMRGLIAHEGAPCLTIYMPIRTAGAHDDEVRWSAMVAQARKGLSAVAHLDVEGFLEPLRELSTLVPSGDQPATLAVFRSGSFTAHYVVPVHIEPAVVVSSRFRLRPLLQYVRTNARYFLLELSHGRVGFFEGSAEGLAPRNVPGLPASADEAVGLEHAERMVSARGSGTGRSVWHGQGKEESTRDEDELKFVRAVDKALMALLHDDTAPLVVAGSGKLLPLFKSRCSYPHLLEDAVHGSFANAPMKELHAKAWPIVQAHSTLREQEIVEQHRKSVSGDRATDEITSITRFAVQGRVRALMVARDAHLWGHMDATSGDVRVHDGRTAPLEEDILDGLVEAVFLRGGDVYTLDVSRMPSRSPAAATLRW